MNCSALQIKTLSRRPLIVALAVAAMASACAGPDGTVGEGPLWRRFGQDSPDLESPIELRVGQTLMLQLSSWQGTTYEWRLVEPLPALLERDQATRRLAGEDRATTLDTELWRLRAVRAGSHEVRLEYRRPRERSVPPLKVVRLQLTVQP